MQELLGRISALDPQASLGLRVIACFDELVVGNVNTRGLLSAAASLAGGNAGYCQDHPPRTLRVTPRGDIVPSAGTPLEEFRESAIHADGITVWIERVGDASPHDAMILERLMIAVRVRLGRGPRDVDLRRDLSIALDPAAALDDRRLAATRVQLHPSSRYRVLAAPLFAVWEEHPAGAEDVIATPYGSIHAVVVPHDRTSARATPIGIGLPVRVEDLHRSFQTALVALRLCHPPSTPVVLADDYGGLVGLLADLPPGSDLPDVDAIDTVTSHPWGQSTLDALVRTSSVRQAARLVSVHHSTMQARIDTVSSALGYDPTDDGIGRTRLGLAYLVWRMRNSRVLDLPAPTQGVDAVSP